MQWGQRDGVLFIGSYNPGNRRVVRWVLLHVWPAVRAAVPTARLQLAGALEWTAEVRETRTSDVEVLDQVRDLPTALIGVRVLAAPAFVASGITTEAFLALGHGVPLVTTPIGSRGLLPMRTPGAVTVARTSAEFATGLITLLINHTEWHRQRDLGQRHAMAHLGAARQQRALRAAFHDLTADS